ncbi:hypothetical protein PVAG01_08395 [Phlyctema vagabunda]|uniref:DUF7730 domain-containing protein n=1 Tax=Phlyctema vagabunda TaxID=108571 RepID=A0ABR4P9A5_9HELO
MSRQHSRRKTVLSGTVTCLTAVCWVPCLCIFATAVGCVYLYQGVRTYESPRARERKCRERVKKDRFRRTPKYIACRNEGSTLTLPLAGERWESGRERREKEQGDVDVDVDVNDEVEMQVFGEKMSCPEDGVLKGKTTALQDASLLFRLPPEIRKMVYEEVLAGYVFHVYFQDAYRRLRAERCKSVEPSFWKEVSPNICKGMVCRNQLRVPGAPDRWGGVALLPLLMSCRRVYSETIEMLYNHNAFEFDSLQTLLQFSMTILPQRLPLMKAVQWKRSTFSAVTYLQAPWHQTFPPPEGCVCAVCIAKEVDLDYALTMYGAI